MRKWPGESSLLLRPVVFPLNPSKNSRKEEKNYVCTGSTQKQAATFSNSATPLPVRWYSPDRLLAQPITDGVSPLPASAPSRRIGQPFGD